MNGFITKLKFLKLLFLSISFFLLFGLFSCNLVFASNNASADKSTLTVNPSSIPADGITAATITVNVRDSSGNVLVEHHVTLSSTSDTGLMINTDAAGVLISTASTDSSGNAVFRIKSNSATTHTDTFTAQDVTSAPYVLLGSATNNNVTVNFTIPTSAPSCSDTVPGAPKLISAISDGSDKIILTWTGATSPISSYSLYYGIASGKYIYGNPNVGGQGTTTYTVGSLAKGTTYYFVMRAVNGCSSGSYSNELSAVAGEVPTPTIAQEGNASNSAHELKSDNSQQSASSSSAQGTPTSTPFLQPTNTPTLIPEVVDSGNTNKIIIYGLLAVVVFGFAGIFCWWKFKKNKKKSDADSEMNSETQSDTNPL